MGWTLPVLGFFQLLVLPDEQFLLSFLELPNFFTLFLQLFFYFAVVLVPIHQKFDPALHVVILLHFTPLGTAYRQLPSRIVLFQCCLITLNTLL